MAAAQTLGSPTDGSPEMLTLGAILRGWRRHANLTVERVAEQLSCAKSAVSQWETDQRRPSRAMLAEFDRVCSADGALVELANAVGSPSGIAPRQAWSHNPTDAPRPGWVWVRSPGRLVGSIGVGVMTATFDRDPNPNGVLFTSPSTIVRPAAWVKLVEPGWVDFGHGVVPPSLGIPIVRAETISRLERRQFFHRQIVDFVRQQSGMLIDITFRSLRRSQQASMRRALHGETSGYHFDYSNDPVAPQPVEVAYPWRSTREARCYSRRELAEAASVLPPAINVTEDQIASLESGRVSRATDLVARLDQCLGMDGSACGAIRTASLSRSGTVLLPQFWVGPVWFRMEGPTPDAVANIKLTWGPWRKVVTLRSGQTITTRKTATTDRSPILSMPEGWKAVIGVGCDSTAIDVNDDWAADPREIFNVVGEYLVPILRYLHLDPRRIVALFGRSSHERQQQRQAG